MKSEALALIGGTLLLLPLWLWRARGVGSLLKFAALLPVGIVVAQIGLAVALQTFELQRRSQFLKVYNEALAQIDAMPDSATVPRLLLVGSSRTARDVDGNFLSKALARSGSHAQVLQLSSPGSYAFEQDYYLDRLLEESQRVPDYVFIELGSDFRGALDPENRYKNDPIAFHDLSRAYDILSTRLDKGGVELAAVTIGHTIAYYMHLGIVRYLTPAGEERRAGFLPEPLPSDAPSKELIKQNLSTQVTLPPISSEIIEYRLKQRERLLGSGIANVIFVAYPTAAPETRARIESLCAALRPCISLNDSKTLELLDGPYWTDLNHLTDVGARSLTEAFAPHILVEMNKNGA
jgi:hypothetical protein